MTPSTSQDVAALLGGVAPFSTQDLFRYAVDGVAPRAVAAPDSVESLSKLLAIASREKLAVAPRGGGVLSRLGNVPSKLDLVVDTTRLSRMVAHEPADMTATLQGGMTMAELRKAVARHGQQLPLDAPLPDRCTIGEVLATAFAGPRRLLHGLPRDWLLGITVVLSSGTPARAGGRVVKNVTGYDLNKLYVGSLGTLGVIVEATFKLIPIAQEERTLVASFPSWQAALAASDAIRSLPFTPCALELLDRRAVSALRQADAEVSLLAALAGRRVAVVRMVSDVAKVLTTQGATRVEELSSADSAALWQAVTDLVWRDTGAPALCLKASLVPSAISEALEGIKSLSLSGFDAGLAVGPGYGGVRLVCFSGGASPEESRRLAASFHQRVQALGGYAVVESASPEVKHGLDVWGDVPGDIEVMRRLKRELDPAGILNPGRYVGGL